MAGKTKKQIRPKYVADVVCPKCFKPLEYPTVIEQETDRYKRVLRTYYGWCFECEKGCLVIQFNRGERWIIHKYRPAVFLDNKNIVQITNNWQVFNDLPLPAPVVIGPGGEYDRAVNPNDVNLGKLLHKLSGVIEGLSRTVKLLIKHIGAGR